MTDANPKLFISYSWTSPAHEQWVLNLATELRESGVDVILDKWDLKEGHDAHAFMEKMVADPVIKKVALICDQLYAEKANGRSGGVGIEAQIISPEIYAKEDQNKFVAIVVQKDEMGNPYLPIYYKSRIYIDLSEDNLYNSNFEQLLRWIYDKPLYVKPELGHRPAFLSDTTPISLGTTSAFKRAFEAIRNNKDYSKGAISEYFNAFTTNLENFRIVEGDGEFDDKIIENIDQFLPYRNEAIQLFIAIAQYRDTPESRQQIHKFFEKLIPYMERPENVTTYRDWDFDNFKFILHELFLYVVSIFLRHESFDTVAYLLRHRFYVDKSSVYSDKMVPFAVFHQYMKSLTRRNERLNLRRLSVRADLLEQRAKASGVPFRELMQADFIIFIRDCMDYIKDKEHDPRWWPETLLYLGRHERAFEIFTRAQSKEYFAKVKCLFDIQMKEDLEPLLLAFKAGDITVPKWQFESFSPHGQLGYDKLATRP